MSCFGELVPGSGQTLLERLMEIDRRLDALESGDDGVDVDMSGFYETQDPTAFTQPDSE